MNQFAKISPIVTQYGELLKIDDNGLYTIKSGRYLKENEMGICVDDFSIIAMYDNGKELIPVKLMGGTFETLEDAQKYLIENPGLFDGKIITTKDKPLSVYTGIGNKTYDITENNSKNLNISFRCNKEYSNGVSTIIETNDITETTEYLSGKNILNNIHITGPKKIGNNDVKSYLLSITDSESMNSIIVIPSTDREIDYFIPINQTIIGKLNIAITDKDFNKITKIDSLEDANIFNINININYTPIK